MFALVHGAWHGAWCWERLVPLLPEAVAVELPVEDVDAGNAEYADAIAGTLAGRDDVVLVAHSQAGLAAPLVAARTPLRAIVYLAALIPEPGTSMAEQERTAPERVLTFAVRPELDEQRRSRWTGFEAAARSLYPDLSEADARWAFARLRPQAPKPWRDPHPRGLPDVPVVSIVCRDDRAVNPDWSRRIARERLGVEPVELAGGHFPMITAPAALAGALDQVRART